MEGQVNTVEEIVSSNKVKGKNVLGEPCITGSSGAGTIIKATVAENEAMDTSAPYEDDVSESNSESNILRKPEENNTSAVNICNMQDVSNCRNINSESSRKESLAICENVYKAGGAPEMAPDEHKNELRGIGTEQSKIESRNNITVQNVNKEEIVGIKENNSNIIVDNSCNISEKTNAEAMITDITWENSEVVSELKENSSNTKVNVGKGNRDPVILDAVTKCLDTAHQSSKLAYQKNVSGLKLLCDYGSDSDDNEECNVEKDLMITSNESAVSNVAVVNPSSAISQEYRKPEVVALSDSEEETDSSEEEDDTSSSSSTATSSSSSDESDDSANTSENECVVVEEKKLADEVPKTTGELGLEDLPPIEDLCISVPESECVKIGHVLSIVDSLVVVQSIKGCPALDLDSILFLDNGHKTLGEVFDVFGKVGEACYCVRFNSKDHALSKGIEIGMSVFYAPKTEHSKFVFLADLLKMKGSDASWENNNEPPPRFLDFSDDDEERKARKENKPQTRDVEPDDTQPRNKKFYQRDTKRSDFGCTKPPNRDYSHPSRSTPFGRYPRPSPSRSPQAGPQPLIRPPSFRTTGPPKSHYHNAAAGAPAMPPTPSPWAVPPPAIRKDFMANIPPTQSHFVQKQMRPRGFNINVGGFGQPPPPPPPPSPASRSYMMPTSIPGAGPFITNTRNLPRPETLNSITSNPPHNFSSFRQGADAQQSFRSQGPVFMNRNVPPPRPPQGW